MSNKKKRVLILGGGGFIGFGLAKFLTENRDYELTIVDDFSSNGRDEEFDTYCAQHSVFVIEGDLSQKSIYYHVNGAYDFVYVLASVVGVNRCIEAPVDVIRINTQIILNVIDWVQSGNAHKLLFASSSENYAATTEVFDYRIPTQEEVPLCVEDTRHPRFTYALTKMLGESAFFNLGRVYGIPITVIRYQNIYGPRMGFKHAIPHIIERFSKGEDPFHVYGATQTRAFGYISDAAEGTVLAMESCCSDQQVYHIGSNHEVTIDHVTRTVGRIMGFTGTYVEDETYPGSVSRRCPDIQKARNELGYEPQISFLDGLKKTVRWYQKFFDSGKEILIGGFKPPESLSYRTTRG